MEDLFSVFSCPTFDALRNVLGDSLPRDEGPGNIVFSVLMELPHLHPVENEMATLILRLNVAGAIILTLLSDVDATVQNLDHDIGGVDILRQNDVGAFFDLFA